MAFEKGTAAPLKNRDFLLVPAGSYASRSRRIQVASLFLWEASSPEASTFRRFEIAAKVGNLCPR